MLDKKGLVSTLTSLAGLLAVAITWESETVGSSGCVCSHALISCLHVASPCSHVLTLGALNYFPTYKDGCGHF